MVGQEDLIKKLTSYSINNFPQTLMLVGDKGCGKHLIVNEIIAPHLKLEVIDITNNISSDSLSDIYIRALPSLYLINVSLLSQKEQNNILKFIEEPLSNSFIVLLTEDKNHLIETVINRCSVYYFESYKEEELLSFIKYKNKENKNIALKICTTPGQIIETTEEKLEKLYNRCKMVTLQIKDASVPNTLKISLDINYKEDTSNFDISMFFKCLNITNLEEYIKNKDDLYFKFYNKTSEYIKRLNNSRINKQVLMDNFLINLWSLSRN
jgi:DNA polymerase III delta prime subunit